MAAVQVKTDCPHASTAINEELDFERTTPCAECGHVGENWVCLGCSRVLCSRFVQGHMAAHNEANRPHAVAMSMLDLSTWCYECDCYIENRTIKLIKQEVSKMTRPPMPADLRALLAERMGPAAAAAAAGEDVGAPGPAAAAAAPAAGGTCGKGQYGCGEKCECDGDCDCGK
eukprot:m.17932 g.17932  ORF g.17932 m.17932 type:complete len:172 (+) comp7248_c0_seq1:1681-2196(+)